jgi:hypothetical protein
LSEPASERLWLSPRGISAIPVGTSTYLEDQYVRKYGLRAALELVVPGRKSSFRQIDRHEGQTVEFAGYRIGAKNLSPDRFVGLMRGGARRSASAGAAIWRSDGRPALKALGLGTQRQRPDGPEQQWQVRGASSRRVAQRACDALSATCRDSASAAFRSCRCPPGGASAGIAENIINKNNN